MECVEEKGSERLISLFSVGLWWSLYPKSSESVYMDAGGMWRRLDGVRQDVGEDLLEQDYPTIFGESADWSSDHS